MAAEKDHHAYMVREKNNSGMESRPSLALHNVTLPSGRVVDLTIRNGMVAHVGAPGTCDSRIDCEGLLVLPAAVDMHVHMRGGSQSEKEDWGTGSRSALAGGVTVVVDQPNTVPPVGTPTALAARVRDAENHAFCHFAINSSVTPDTPFEAMWDAGAMAFGETFYAPSSYGDAISRDNLWLAFNRIRALDGLATIHAEEISKGSDLDLSAHNQVRSIGGEVRAVLAVREINTPGCRLHFCHLSSARSIEAATGSIEVTPHHLFLSLENFPHDDPHGKVNPPLRTEKERKEIWRLWDRIDVIASDHAPHTDHEKQQDFPSAPSGIPGVETMVPLLLAEVIAGKISLLSVIEKTSWAPARILGIPKAGFDIGDRADFALYPKETEIISADTLHSRCGWTPFEGQAAIFPRTVILGGEIAYHEEEFTKTHPSWFPGKGFVPVR